MESSSSSVQPLHNDTFKLVTTPTVTGGLIRTLMGPLGLNLISTPSCLNYNADEVDKRVATQDKLMHPFVAIPIVLAAIQWVKLPPICINFDALF